jgi:hypothetical protein
VVPATSTVRMGMCCGTHHVHAPREDIIIIFILSFFPDHVGDGRVPERGHAGSRRARMLLRRGRFAAPGACRPLRNTTTCFPFIYFMILYSHFKQTSKNTTKKTPRGGDAPHNLPSSLSQSHTHAFTRIHTHSPAPACTNAASAAARLPVGKTPAML